MLGTPTTLDHLPKPIQLFVLPSSTWVLTSDIAGQRVGWALASSAAEPPSLDALPGSFSQSTMVVDGEMVARSASWVRNSARIVAGGQVLYPPRPDGTMAYGSFLVFSDEGSARDAGADAQRLFADPATRERLMPGGAGAYVGVQTVGRVVIYEVARGGNTSTVR